MSGLTERINTTLSLSEVIKAIIFGENTGKGFNIIEIKYKYDFEVDEVGITS